LLSLLHIIRRRTGLDTSAFFDQSPEEVEQYIFEEIEWREYDTWFRVAETLVMWESREDGAPPPLQNLGRRLEVRAEG
jgi:hypothetical protein